MAGASKYSNIPVEEDDESDLDDGVVVQSTSSEVAGARPSTYTHIPAEESDGDESGSDNGMRETASPNAEVGVPGEGNNTGTRPRMARKDERDFNRSLFLFILILACVLIILGGALILTIWMTHGEDTIIGPDGTQVPQIVTSLPPTVNYTYSPTTMTPSIPTPVPSQLPESTFTPDLPNDTSTTPSPTYMPTSELVILLTGNTIEFDDFSLTFPPYAFNDSRITIQVGDCNEYDKQLHDASTLAHGALSLVNTADITSNAYTFIVEKDPIASTITEVSYRFTMP